MMRILMLNAVTRRERKDATTFVFDTVNDEPDMRREVPTVPGD